MNWTRALQLQSNYFFRWKGQCPFALVQHTEKFWNIFFETFRAGMLFFSGEEEHSSSKRLEENNPELYSVLY